VPVPVPVPQPEHAVAFVVANDGVEQIELTEPWLAVTRAGFRPVLLASTPGRLQATTTWTAPTVPVDLTTGQAHAEDYVAFVLPGGVANPDILRRDRPTHRLLQQADTGNALIAAISHGPRTLIDAGLVAGRTLAAYPSLATDLTNAGATWTLELIHVQGNRLTAQSDADIEAFVDRLLQALSASLGATTTNQPAAL